MGRQPIRTGEHYDALIGAAHRHPALATGPLALIRYRCWWIEPNGVPGRSPTTNLPDFAGDAEELKKAFELARYTILTRIGGTGDLDAFVRTKGGQDYADPTAANEKPDYRYFSIPVVLGEEKSVLRLTITQHDDRISMSEVLDLIPAEDPQNYAAPAVLNPDNPEKKNDLNIKTKVLMNNLSGCLAEVHRVIAKLEGQAWLEGKDRISSSDADVLLAKCEWLQQDFWQELPIGVFQEQPPHSVDREVRLAADIRGLIVPQSIDLLCIQNRSKEPQEHTLKRGEAATASITDPLATARQYWELIKAWEIARTGKSQPARGMSPPGPPRPLSLSDREMVVCTALEGRAIYASSLGFGRNRNKDVPAFISYLCIASTRNRRQLGRLVDRVSSMGMLRIIAIRDLPKLREASRAIRDMGPELTLIETRINSAAPPFVPEGSREGKGRPLAETEAELREFGRKLSAIGADIRGGLPYRVARARLYAESYDNILEGMRFKRIEGFLPYDEFIRRRVRENFSFIARLGERHRQLLDRYRTAIELSQSISLRSIAEETNALARAGHAVEFVAVTYYGAELLLKLSLLIEPAGPSTFVKVASVVLAPVLWYVMRPTTLRMIRWLRTRLSWIGRRQPPSRPEST